jgi:hypothetical protein
MKTPTTHQQLQRVRRYLIVLGLTGVLGLEVFAYFDLHYHTPLEMPVFLAILSIFITCGAFLSNALRCPKCALHLNRCYNTGAGRDLQLCPKCGADFNTTLPRSRH